MPSLDQIQYMKDHYGRGTDYRLRQLAFLQSSRCEKQADRRSSCEYKCARFPIERPPGGLTMTFGGRKARRIKWLLRTFTYISMQYFDTSKILIIISKMAECVPLTRTKYRQLVLCKGTFADFLRLFNHSAKRFQFFWRPTRSSSVTKYLL